MTDYDHNRHSRTDADTGSWLWLPGRDASDYRQVSRSGEGWPAHRGRDRKRRNRRAKRRAA